MERDSIKHDESKMGWVLKEPCADWTEKEQLEYIALEKQETTKH